MAAALQDVPNNIPAPAMVVQQAAKKGPKSVETVYQKKTQLEHILLRPDTYIGSVEYTTEQMWIFDPETDRIVQKEISFVPGLYKIYDEILVNAADNKQRDPGMDTIKVEIDPENNVISVYNNGKGIPVAMHKEEKMYVPTMIFGHLLTSSNYNDDEQKVTGGRNGYGAKLCNIFSNKFVVETASKEYKKNFKQTWGTNMSKTSDAKIKDYGGEDFTKITFSPDLVKFKMESLDKDIVSLMSRRAYDIAASTKGVKVYLNGKRVPVKNFKDYVDLYLKDKVDDADNPVKPVYENVNERWEVAVALSDKGFQQMSFVNSIATTKGGRHIDYVTDMIVKNLTETLKKKNKSGVQIKPFQIKNHMWIFVNCLIVNPTFDSQTKENMTLQAKSFGSKCSLSDKFINNVMKCGIVEAVMTWARFKQQAQLQSKCANRKQNKLKGIPKLEDANDAGTKFSSDCTLILTEGDSAKALAVAGLGVVGRDRYGVFPLRGKLLNVREASHSKILENAEINNIIKILGLQYKKKYDSSEDLKSLRYGKLMIMTDQDQDGSHIKGLLINFIHHNWPTLLRHTFMEEFITPIVKATKGKEELSFYSLPEFEEWKKNKDNWPSYKIKYYKGLGTSTSKEAKEYFNDMVRHRIRFNYGGAQDDHSIQMAFSKKAIEQRKEWLTGWMEECKRRKELGLPEVYLYERDTRAISYTDFVNKELVLFSNLDNERSIPCLVDGLKPGQRKVLFTCLKRNDKREVKVAQLAGSVAEHSAYHHGEASLMSTIINLAQNYIGSNNINLLQPIGQFGTRLQGGKDHASPRYIFTMLSKLARYIFHPHDDPLLKSNFDDNQRIEPEWYMPILPMVLVNGAEGIGTGWSTRIHNYNPREIVENLKRMLRGEEPTRMVPWFKDFRGTVEELDSQRCIVHGEIANLGGNKIEITELPVRVWTQAYKETVLEGMLASTEKSPAMITDYKEYHTDTTVRFTVTISEAKLGKAMEEGLHKTFKLTSSLSTNSMVLFDHNGVLRKFEAVEEILREFFDLRLKYYSKRKQYLVGMIQAEASKLSNQARFILEKCDGRLVIENKKKKDMIAELQRKGFDSDPVKAWKRVQDREAALEEEEMQSESDREEVDLKGPDYDYLLGMAMWSLTKERKDELLKKRDEKNQELEELKKKTPDNLWLNDLDEFLNKLDEVEREERESEEAANKKSSAGTKKVKKVRN
ncbi:DNA topoisomerase 2-alpha isoform X2 [Penaeus vannamei]|uniref:DNA topoisomerase 2-alpha isoform X2 n=1 Tax=Penaeus vannamei TaxID=6689 RepID=UPI00387F4D36